MTWHYEHVSRVWRVRRGTCSGQMTRVRATCSHAHARIHRHRRRPIICSLKHLLTSRWSPSLVLSKLAEEFLGKTPAAAVFPAGLASSLGRGGEFSPPKALSQGACSSAWETGVAASIDTLLRLLTMSLTGLMALPKSRAFIFGSRSERVAMKNSPQKTMSSSVARREGGRQKFKPIQMSKNSKTALSWIYVALILLCPR